MGADEIVAHRHQFCHIQHRSQVQPGPRRRGEPDAVVLRHFIREEGQQVPYDVGTPRDAETAAPGEVDPPVTAPSG